MQADGGAGRGLGVVELAGGGERVAVGGGGAGETPGQAARVGQFQQQAQPVRGAGPTEVEQCQAAFEVGEGVIEGEPGGRLGAGLPRVADGTLARRGIPGGRGRPEMGGQFGRVDHGAFGAGRFQGGAEVVVAAAAGGGGQVRRQDLAEQVVGEPQPGPTVLGHQHPGRGRLLGQDGQAGVIAEHPGQQPGTHRRPIQGGQGEHADARLGQAGEPTVDHAAH